MRGWTSSGVRPAVLQLHRWLALVGAPALLFMALTGVAMLPRPQLEAAGRAALHPAAACAAPLTADQVVVAASLARPGAGVRQIEFAPGDGIAPLVRFADLDGLYVDPCSGRVLGIERRWGGWLGAIEWLHRMRFVPSVAASETVTGTIALLFATALVSGLVAWWPRSRAHLKASLTPRSRLRGPAWRMHLHRVLGCYAAAVLLASAAAGCLFTLDGMRAGWLALTASAPAAKPRVAAAGARASLQDLLQAAQSLAPHPWRLALVLPRDADDPVEAQVLATAATHPAERTIVYLDPRTAAPLRIDDYARRGVGYRIYRWLGSFHRGEVGGLAGQAILGAAMLVLFWLLWTGLANYWRRASR